MSLIKCKYGDSSNISTDITPLNEGTLYVTYGGDLYADLNGQRIQIVGASSVARQEIITTIYPVGSIYISTSSADPATLFGLGTWERIEDCFLLAAGNNHIAGETGGEETVALDVEQIPSHNHSLSNSILTSDTNNGTFVVSTSTFLGTKSLSTIDRTDSVGSGTAHNNMPPYLSVYVWKRIE